MLVRMEQANEAFGQLYRLTVQFTEMLRNRQPDNYGCGYTSRKQASSQN